jgi:hypothetical protein
MIRLAGTAKRSFIFPGNLQDAMQHYANLEKLFEYLPFVSLINTFSTNQFRVRYASTELNIYKIQLYCDLEVVIDKGQSLINVKTLDANKPTRPKAGLHSSRGNASFASNSRFVPEGENTRIYYSLELNGKLPTPKAFSLVPLSITNHIAETIAKRRIFEIADGFIMASLADFQSQKKSVKL